MGKRSRRFRTLAAYLASPGALSQSDLARRLETSQPEISRIAAGLKVPAPALAVRLAKLARIPLESFTRVYLAARRDKVA